MYSIYYINHPVSKYFGHEKIVPIDLFDQLEIAHPQRQNAPHKTSAKKEKKEMGRGFARVWRGLEEEEEEEEQKRDGGDLPSSSGLLWLPGCETTAHTDVGACMECRSSP